MKSFKQCCLEQKLTTFFFPLDSSYLFEFSTPVNVSVESTWSDGFKIWPEVWLLHPNTALDKQLPILSTSKGSPTLSLLSVRFKCLLINTYLTKSWARINSKMLLPTCKHKSLRHSKRRQHTKSAQSPGISHNSFCSGARWNPVLTVMKQKFMVKPQVLEQFQLYFSKVSFYLLLATERLSICKTAAMSLTPQTFEMAYIIVKHLCGCAHVAVYLCTQLGGFLWWHLPTFLWGCF